MYCNNQRKYLKTKKVQKSMIGIKSENKKISYIKAIKGQSAIEYIMTYGWMLIIVAIIGGGVLTFTTERNLNYSNFNQNHFQITDSGLTRYNTVDIRLKNPAGGQITIKEVNISDSISYNLFTDIEEMEESQISLFGFEKTNKVNTVNLSMTYSSGKLENLQSKGQLTGNFKPVNEIKCETSASLKPTSDYKIINNQWSRPDAKQCIKQDSKGLYGWQWDATDIEAGKGPNYPEIFIGTRPWGSNTDVESFPIQAQNIENFSLDLETELKTKRGEWNQAIEWWVMNSTEYLENNNLPAEKRIKYEVMLVTDWEDQGHPHVEEKSIFTDKYGNTYDLWQVYKDAGGTGNDFYIFRIQGKHQRGKIDLEKINNYMLKQENFQEDHYITGVEVGNEYWGQTKGNNKIKELNLMVNQENYSIKN